MKKFTINIFALFLAVVLIFNLLNGKIIHNQQISMLINAGFIVIILIFIFIYIFKRKKH